MGYRIKLYDKNGTLESVLLPVDFEIKSFSKIINSAGKALFSVPKSSEKAVKSTFQKYKRIKIFRYSEAQSKYIVKWSGYIEQVNEVLDRFDIGCVGLLDIFNKRLTSASQAIIGDAGGQALALLSQTNLVDDTHINVGIDDYATAISIVADKKPILSVWNDLARSANGEFEITDDTDTLNFFLALGTDKSSTVQLVFDENQPERNNLSFAKIQETGKQIYNKIIGIGKTSGGTAITSTKSDVLSIAKYGLLEKVESFNDAETQAQLDLLTQNFLDQFSDEIDNPEIRVLKKQTKVDILGNTVSFGLDLDDIDLGDIIALRFKTSYNNVIQNRRIVSFTVSVDNGGNEDIKLKLNKIGQNLEIISSLQADVQSIKARQKQADLIRRVYS